MSNPGIRRIQYTAEERAVLVAEYRSSGETQQAFAHRHGIKWTTFRNWLYGRTRVARTSKPPVGFQEVPASSLMQSNVWGAEIALSGGTVVRIKAGTDPAWVSSIVQPLRRPC